MGVEINMLGQVYGSNPTKYIARGQCSRRRHDKDLLMFYDFMSLNDSVSLGEGFLLTSRDFNIEYFVWKYVIICLFTNKFYYEESTAKIKKKSLF